MAGAANDELEGNTLTVYAYVARESNQLARETSQEAQTSAAPA